MTKVDSILAAAENLPPYPPVAQKALNLLSDPEFSASELVRIIGFDPSITAEMLRMCNSPYFGLVRRVGSIQQAITLLGQRSMVQLIVSSSSLRYFKRYSPGYDVEGKELWRHSVAVALMADIVRRRLGLEAGEVLFTAGLLHDIGKLVLSSFVAQDMQVIARLVEKEQMSFLEAEKKALGMNHAELGGHIARKWSFPEDICRAIEHHHTPRNVPEDDLVTPVIYLANITCLLAGQGGTGVDGLKYRGYDDVVQRFRLRTRDLHAYVIALEEDLRATEELLRADWRSEADADQHPGSR